MIVREVIYQKEELPGGAQLTRSHVFRLSVWSLAMIAWSALWSAWFGYQMFIDSGGDWWADVFLLTIHVVLVELNRRTLWSYHSHNERITKQIN